MGVYSMRDKSWKLYGDFCFVGSVAFSPDGRKLAFKTEARINNPNCLASDVPPVLQILDLETGQFTPVPDSISVIGNSQLSWSPDGSYLAVAKYSREKSPGHIVVIDLRSWVQKVVAEGADPSWSPKGEWIAYQADWSETCMLIHPDGTGAKTVLDLRRRSGGWVFANRETWSPDGNKLLLTEGPMDSPKYDITILDLASGEVTTKSKNGALVFGWATEIK
jgi:Tol biopolymer transport system component